MTDSGRSFEGIDNDIDFLGHSSPPVEDYNPGSRQQEEEEIKNICDHLIGSSNPEQGPLSSS